MTEPKASGPSPKAHPIKAPPDPGRPVAGTIPNMLKIGVSRFDWRDPYHAALTLPGPRSPVSPSPPSS